MRRIQLAIGAVLALVLYGAVSAPGIAQAATCTTSAAMGTCGPYTDPNVYRGANGSDLVAQDVWNQINGWHQTLTATNDNSWNVSANMPNGNTAVVSYPDTQVTYTLTNGKPDPISDFGTVLNSSWANINPTGSGLDYEYAYDIWLADVNQNSWTNDQEIMIWTDNHGQRPAGNDTGNHFTDAAGTQWEVWTDPGNTTVGSTAIVSFVRSNAASGSVDLMGFYNYLRSSGYTNANAGVDQIGYGVELCSTGGVSKTFGLTGYTLTKGAPVQQAPVVTTNAASGVTSTGATLNGSVNPEGQATTYQFDYGTTTSYGTSVPSPAGSAGSGSSAVNENANLTGLSPGTTYHYRIEATNATGTSFGSDQTFTTSSGASAPAVTTNAATNVTSSGATLNGSVNPESQSTTYQFDYGTTTSYGTSVPVPAGSAGSGSSAVNESANISGLTASTTYHYRIEATNATGTSFGQDQTFTTSSSGGSGTVSYDATGHAMVSHSGSLSWTHTVGSGADRALLVGVGVGVNQDGNCVVTVKDNGTVMTQLDKKLSNNQSNGFEVLDGRVNPPSGANTIAVTVTGCNGGTPDALTGGSMSFANVSQSAPFSATVKTGGSSAHPLVTVSSTFQDIAAAVTCDGSSISSAVSPAVSRYIANENNNTGAGNSAGATASQFNGSVPFQWNAVSDWWGAIGVDVQHD